MARAVAVGLPHHITQRGNYRYCLMQNHVHFIAIPSQPDSLARVFNNAHARYSQYLNNKLKRRGHLWQGRFYSCVLDESHLVLAARYIERNPVRAGLVEKPWQWPWSSAITHIDKNRISPIELGDLLGIIGISYDLWKEYIDSTEEENLLQRIRKFTLTGRPLGTTEFIEMLEVKFNKKLCELPIGRPKSQKKSRCPY